MVKEEEAKREPEVITFKELVERNENIKKEELLKLVLVCKNCSHKDLLGNFIKKKKRGWNMIDENDKPIGDNSPAPDPNPWKPYKPYKPYKPHPDINPWKQPNPYNKYYTKAKTGMTKKLSNLLLGEEEYEDMFFCPKCKSSLVVLDPDFVKNNVLRGMEDG